MSAPSKPTTTTFGRRLRQLRLRAGLSQEKLGVAIGLDEGTATVRIGRYETGVHEPPNVVVDRLASVLGVAAPFFHCADDDLAEVLLAWDNLPRTDRLQITEFVRGLLAEKRTSGHGSHL